MTPQNIPDDFDPISDLFHQQPLSRRVFLNSVPKSGTHLLRNIARAFISNSETYRPFIVDHDFTTHQAGLDNPSLKFFCGHLNFHNYTACGISGMRHILLVRDPYDYVLSMTRFLYSENINSPVGKFVRENNVDVTTTISFVINGLYEPDMYLASTADIYRENAVKWLSMVDLIRYEDVLSAVSDIEQKSQNEYLKSVLRLFGIDNLPADWEQRVATGSNSEYSATHHENLTIKQDIYIPRFLPSAAQRQVNLLAPGLRETLGYGAYH